MIYGETQLELRAWSKHIFCKLVICSNLACFCSHVAKDVLPWTPSSSPSKILPFMIKKNLRLENLSLKNQKWPIIDEHGVIFVLEMLRCQLYNSKIVFLKSACKTILHDRVFDPCSIWGSFVVAHIRKFYRRNGPFLSLIYCTIYIYIYI